MKWIIVILVLFNVGLGGYQFWLSNQPVAAVVEAQELGLNNLALSQDQRDRLASAAQPVSLNQPQDQPQCIRITGLTAGDSAPVVESRLRALEVNTDITDEQQLLKTDYQVLLGPFNDSASARDALAEILEIGVEGYVIASGENANALSLGVFSRESNAQRRISELAELGSTPTIFKKEHFVDATVINIDENSAKLLNDETLMSVLSAFENADFMRYSCN